MKRQGLVYTAAIITYFMVGAAAAGFNTEGTVVVNDTSFEGIMGGARNSTNNVELLICRDDGTSVTCGATDSTGNTKACVTSDPNHVSIVRGLTESARVHVEFNGAGECTSMWGANSSSYQPKQ